MRATSESQLLVGPRRCDARVVYTLPQSRLGGLIYGPNNEDPRSKLSLLAMYHYLLTLLELLQYSKGAWTTYMSVAESKNCAPAP